MEFIRFVKSVFRPIFGRMPKAGDIYEFDEFEEMNPFETTNRLWQVKIIETKGKWIKYIDLSFPRSVASSKPKYEFLCCYRKVK